MKKSNLAVTAAVTGLLALGGTLLTATPAVAAEKRKSATAWQKRGKMTVRRRTALALARQNKTTRKTHLWWFQKVFATNWLAAAPAHLNFSVNCCGRVMAQLTPHNLFSSSSKRSFT